MACSTLTHGKKIEVEDLFLRKDEDASLVETNREIYIEMLHNVEEWVSRIPQDDPSFHVQKEFNKYYAKMTRKYRVMCRKNILVYVYRTLIAQNKMESSALMWQLLQKRPARNLSGVTIITVLTSPHPDGQSFSCKHNCYYCPNEPGQPRSYLKKEPAVARANRNQFDPILQMSDRIKSLMVNGHEIDKIEIIIEGGTYTEYPPAYLERFHRDLIYCANTYFDEEKRDPLTVEEEVAINATTKVRIIGICIETRPDALTDDDGTSWLPRFRKWGVTRVQLGVQHTNNDILKKINRGHTIEDAERAIRILKNNCFKVDIHLMPDLPFSSPEKDNEMFDYVFRTPLLQPDQIKIYPCEVTPWTVIQQWHNTGKFKPYAQTNERALLDVVKRAMEMCPPWIRLPRVIRDIPLTYIEGGNMYPNLRQMLMDEIEKEGRVTMDIRARECGRNPQYKREDAVLQYRTYDTMGGKEFFIAMESPDKKCIFGFLRLRIPHQDHANDTEFPELKDSALIRELHVYGNLVPVGCQKKRDAQHKGFGKKMIAMAEQIAKYRGKPTISVISGIGVTEYYKALGYEERGHFLVKEIDVSKMKQVLQTIIAIAWFGFFMLYLIAPWLRL